ncbi:MAG: sterol desaturase family protein [Burkholderiaceae bacterium]
MHMNKWSYRADFVVYPLLDGVALTLAFAHVTLATGASRLAEVLAGVVLWTLIEYLLHRWVLHHWQPFKGLHDAHHAHPSEFIGTPSWVSGGLFLALWAALATALPPATAAALSAGLMLGYLIYAIVHDVMHHRRVRHGSWLHRAKLRHARHHSPGAQTDFGVTTGVWDVILGTQALSGRTHP